MDAVEVESMIEAAFREAEYPGDWCLRRSNEGDEPFLVEEEFRGKTDWRSLDPKFLDQAPGGFGSALSFFSDEAFRFYLPAYLIASLRGLLVQADVLFHLVNGFDGESRDDHINPRRYGTRTWFDYSRHRFSMFNREQAVAILAFLGWERNSPLRTDREKRQIDEAMEHYWSGRAA